MDFLPIDVYLQAEILYKKGYSCTKIGETLGIDRKRVSAYLKSKGYTVKVIAGNHNKVNVQQKYKYAESLFLKGTSLRSISILLNISRSSFTSWLKKRGHLITTTRKPSLDEISNRESKLKVAEEHFKEFNSLNKAADFSKIGVYPLRNYLESKGYDTTFKRKLHENESLFETIDSEEKAYWLGFLYADAYVNRFKNVLEIGLSSIDITHLVKFRTFLNSNREIKPKKVYVKDKIYSSHKLSIYNKKIVEDLINLGCFENKSLIIKFPDYNIVPKELMIHFIRGYFDGDGSLSFCKRRNNNEIALGFISNAEFLEGLRIELNLPQRKLDKTGNVFALRYSGVKIPLALLDLMYEDATIFLDRKYYLYKEFKANREKVNIKSIVKKEALDKKYNEATSLYLELRSIHKVSEITGISRGVISNILKRQDILIYTF